MKAYQKGKVVWAKNKCRVWCNSQGAATYDYLATQTSGSPRCTFTLFCEVGAPYQPLFTGFFEKFKVVGKVDYGNERPYISDKIEKIQHGQDLIKTA
jgi:hypothetical protein